MPAFAFEYENSKIEGVKFHFQTHPVAIHPAADGRTIRAIECVRMELGGPDASGRRKPQPVDGSNFSFACDMVIPAIGQSRFLEFLAQCRGIEVRDGCVAVNRETGQTADPRYFAGGDCVNGGREVVDAVAEGKRAALGIGRYLEGRDG